MGVDAGELGEVGGFAVDLEARAARDRVSAQRKRTPGLEERQLGTGRDLAGERRDDPGRNRPWWRLDRPRLLVATARKAA